MKTRFIAAAAAALLSSGAQATVVTSTTTIAIPQTLDGVYVNLVTGTTGFSDASPPSGWDINPYRANGTGIGFFWPSSPTGTSGGVATTTTGPYLSLTQGSVVSSSSVFSTTLGLGPASAFQTAGTHILGVRFFNEATSAINYGYVTIRNGEAGGGFPASILGWSYENSGAAITVGGTVAAVPEPATWAMMIGGFGIAGASLRRRRQKMTVTYA